MQVVYLKESKLQAIQLNSRPRGPFPHIPFATKLAVFIDKEYLLPSDSVEGMTQTIIVVTGKIHRVTES